MWNSKVIFSVRRRKNERLGKKYKQNFCCGHQELDKICFFRNYWNGRKKNSVLIWKLVEILIAHSSRRIKNVRCRLKIDGRKKKTWRWFTASYRIVLIIGLNQILASSDLIHVSPPLMPANKHIYVYWTHFSIVFSLYYFFLSPSY